MAPCHEPRSEARRRRRRRATTKPTMHANDSPRRSSRRIKRRPDPTSTSREPERATAVPSLFHTHGGRFTVQRNFLSSMRNFRGASFVFFFVISDAALSPGAFVCLVRYASALPRLAVASWLRGKTEHAPCWACVAGLAISFSFFGRNMGGSRGRTRPNSAQNLKQK